MKTGRNREWGRMPQEAKNLFYENLPLPWPIIAAIFFAIVFFVPLLIRNFLPEFAGIADYVAFFLLVVFVLWIALSLFSKYKQKTGRDFNEDIIDIQNRQGTLDSGKEGWIDKRGNVSEKLPIHFKIFIAVFAILALAAIVIMVFSA